MNFPFLKPKRSSKHLYRHRQPTRLNLIFPTLFFILLCLALYYFLRSNYLRINKIECSLDQQQCPDTHQHILNNYHGKLSPFLKPSQISQEYLAQDPSLATAQIEIVFPHTLRATLSSESTTLTIGLANPPELVPNNLLPQAATPSTESSLSPPPNPIITSLNTIKELAETINITSRGIIIPSPNNSGEPKLYLALDPNILSAEQLTQIYHFNQELVLSTISFTKGWVINDNLIISLHTGEYVIFSLKHQPGESVNTLQQIRTTDTIKSDRAIIDLRFNKPVISTY